MSKAGLYNLWSRLIYLAFTEPFLLGAKRRVCARIRELARNRILEVGCGTCVQGVMIAKTGVNVTGVDLSDKLFPSPEATRLPPSFSFFQADGRNLPFPDGRFDCVLTSMVLHEMNPPDRVPALREMIRVLADGGILLIMDFDFQLETDKSPAALIIRLIERIAGEEHHRNFLDFMSAGGIPPMLHSLGYAGWKRHPIFFGRGGVFELPPNRR